MRWLLVFSCIFPISCAWICIMSSIKKFWMANYFKGNVLITLCFTFIPFNFFLYFFMVEYNLNICMRSWMHPPNSRQVLNKLVQRESIKFLQVYMRCEIICAENSHGLCWNSVVSADDKSASQTSVLSGRIMNGESDKCFSAMNWGSWKEHNTRTASYEQGINIGRGSTHGPSRSGSFVKSFRWS